MLDHPNPIEAPMAHHDAFTQALDATIPPLSDAIQAALPLLGMVPFQQRSYRATLSLSCTPGGKPRAPIDPKAQRTPREQEALSALLPRLEALFLDFSRAVSLLPAFAHPFYRPGLHTIQHCVRDGWSAYLSIGGFLRPVTAPVLRTYLIGYASRLPGFPSSIGTPVWRIHNAPIHATTAAHALAILRVLKHKEATPPKTLPVVSQGLDSKAIHQQALALLNAT